MTGGLPVCNALPSNGGVSTHTLTFIKKVMNIDLFPDVAYVKHTILIQDI